MNILITGARSGIGYMSGIELAKKGHIVYLTVHTNSQLEQLMKNEEVQAENIRCLKLDITKNEDIDEVKNLEIDVLINNAAIGIGGSIIETDMDKIRECYNVNVFGTIQVTRPFLERMIKRDSGKILMLSSALSEMPFAWLSIYSSTKAAIKNMALALNKELKEIDSNVKIIIIEPGSYHTGFNQVMLQNKYDNYDSMFKEIKERIHNKEEAIFGLIECNNLNSIVNKIVEAVEDKDPNEIYKAPFIQSVISKAYNITKK